MVSETLWDIRWLALANHIGTWSKDPSTKVGCVIVGSANQVLTQGYNGFPRGVNDNVTERQERPLKYKWTEHAERNALYNAARTGTSVKNSTIYVAWFPCSDCARGLVQSGIACIVTTVPNYSDAFLGRWGDDFKISNDILSEAGVTVRYVS